MNNEDKQKYLKELLLTTYNQAYSNKETYLSALLSRLTDKLKELITSKD